MGNDKVLELGLIVVKFGFLGSLEWLLVCVGIICFRVGGVGVMMLRLIM